MYYLFGIYEEMFYVNPYRKKEQLLKLPEKNTSFSSSLRLLDLLWEGVLFNVFSPFQNGFSSINKAPHGECK